MKVGDEYYDSPEFQEILKEYEEAVKTGEPVFTDAADLTEIADYYQLLDRDEEAEMAIQEALRKDPGGVAPLTYRIHEALEQGDSAKAWEYLHQITDTYEPDYVYDKGEILIAEERADEAEDYFLQEMKKVPPQEIQDYILDVAKVFSDYGLNEKAMKWISKARENNATDFKELMAHTLFGLGKYKDSEKLFNELIDTDPFQKRYWTALAIAQFMREDYSAAIESSEYAIAIDPQDPDGLIGKANSLYRLSNYEASAEYYRRYLKQKPNDEFALLHLGTCLTTIGQHEEAIELLEKAVETAADDSPYLADICEELAFTYSEKGDVESAIAWLEKTDKMDCDHVQITVIKGHVMLAAHRVAEATKFFRKAILESNEPAHTLLRVIVSLYDNRYLEACYRLLKKFFQMAGRDNNEGYAYMALCCHDLKHKEEYLKYLKIACKVNKQECRMVLEHLFPKDIEPEDYYGYEINHSTED